MKVTFKQDSDILSLVEPEDNAATLSKMPGRIDGPFVYRVEYGIDIAKALQHGSTSVDVLVSPFPIVSSDPASLTKSSTTQELLSNLLLRNPLRKDSVRTSAQTAIVVHRSDFTKVIDNSSLRALKQQVAGTNVKQGGASRTAIVQGNKVVSVGSLGNTDLPVFDSQNTEPESTVLSFQSLAKSLLSTGNEDPAQILGKKTNEIATLKNQVGGLLSNTKFKDAALSKAVRDSLLGIKQNNPRSSTNELSNDSVVGTWSPNKPITKFKTVVEYISIDNNLISSSTFYLTFRIRNSRGVTIQTITKLVRHDLQMAIFRLPVKPPMIQQYNKTGFGQVIIATKQEDINGEAIRLYRKDTTTSLKTALWTLVGQQNTISGDDYVRFVDYYNSTHPVIYRAVTVNRDGIAGADFASLMVRTSKAGVPALARGNPVHNPSWSESFVSITGSPQNNNTVSLTISDFPTDVIAFKLYRRDLSIIEGYPGTLVDDGLFYLPEREGNGESVQVIDRDVLVNRIYEYSCKLLYKTGREVDSPIPLVLANKPIQNNIVSISITPPVMEQSGNDVDVSFVITKEVLQNSADRVKKFLTEQGFIGEFQDEIIADRSKLGQLFAVVVQRTNLSNGMVEDFGVLPDDNFSDRAVGIARGVVNPEPGVSYRYTITTYARNIETMLPTLSKEGDAGTPLAYSYLPSEWLHPITLANGNIVSENSLRRNYASLDFTFGTIVDVKEFDISLAEIRPTVNSATARVISEDKVVVRWTIQGDTTKIDHFLIILEMLGGSLRTTVGKAHSLTGNSNIIEWIDLLENNESGGLTYVIVPVYLDYSSGVETRTNEILI